MVSQREHDKALGRIKDLEAMLDTLSARCPESEFRWEEWDTNAPQGHSKRIYLPDRGRIFIELGKDRHGRTMKLEITPGSGPDGTRGVHIRGEHLLRIVNTGASNTTYVTEQDPRDVPLDKGD